MAAARSTGPPMPSGSRSVCGTCTVPSLPLAGAAGMAPVMSVAVIGDAKVCGIATCALSSVFGADVLFDCRPIGVGEVIDGAAGAGISGLTAFSAGACAGGACSFEFSIGGICGALPMSSSVIAILKVLSTITITLTPTSTERILDVTVEGALSTALFAVLSAALALSPPLSLAAAFAAARLAFSSTCAAAAACAARRAAAMKLDELTGSFLPAGISLIALSEAAIRSDGDDIRPAGRVPGSSG